MNSDKPAIVLSVLTVTFRDTDGVGRTLDSLRRSFDVNDPRVEVIVKDGGTGEPFSKITASFPWAKFMVRPDAGVYDAMNQSLAASAGRFVWFLNGGDECILEDSSTLLAELEREPENMLLFDFVRVYGNGKKEYRRARRVSYLWHGLPTSHQAILYPGAHARALGYDVSYRVSADYAFTSLLSEQVGTRMLGFPLAQFHVGGLSTAHVARVAKDANRVQREILGTPWFLRLLSSMRHAAARAMLRAKYLPATRARR